MTRTLAFCGRGTAEALELALLEHAQKLRLRRRCHLGDFVQEQHAAAGQFDLPRLGLLRPGEGAPLMSEQLGLEQLLGQRGAVERNEWPALPRRRAMDEARDHFLPGARLAVDEYGRVGTGDLGRLLEHVPPLR
jgi:hypothetical protein